MTKVTTVGAVKVIKLFTKRLDRVTRNKDVYIPGTRISIFQELYIIYIIIYHLLLGLQCENIQSSFL